MLRVRLNDLLSRRGMSQRELARRTESHPDVISRFAREATGAVSYDLLERICGALNCDVGDLLQYVPSPDDQIGLFEVIDTRGLSPTPLDGRKQTTLRVAEERPGYNRAHRDQQTGDSA
jgi:putative transcriptional regulator